MGFQLSTKFLILRLLLVYESVGKALELKMGKASKWAQNPRKCRWGHKVKAVGVGCWHTYMPWWLLHITCLPRTSLHKSCCFA
ncbi:hypothetical protein SDJN03_11619, partial [Cucurbita argyrosperma subsp. sororia]